MAYGLPARVLLPLVRHYCGYEEISPALLSRREVPSGDVTLILSLGPTLRVRDVATPASSGRTLGSFVASLHESAVVTEYSGHQHGVEVSLTPLGAYQLFGVAMHELTNQVVDLVDVWGRDAESLAERLHGVRRWDARFDLLDAFFARRVASAREPSGEVAWAWRELRQSHGRVAIRDLVEELGWSHRRLIADFREQIGLPPKTLARVLRFDQVVRRLRAEGGGSFAQIAMDCGYFDQAHLNRDFREFAGTTPGAYANQLLPDGGGVSAS